MQNTVVSLKICESGTANVALSRTTLLRGLHIMDFSENKFYADPAVTALLRNMIFKISDAIMNCYYQILFA